ncbi:Type IV conjugative transfer system protein TraV (plasmid) [Acinetobacter baumannii]|nr:hypothetical protein [Acinetobacter baumannii]AOX83420.1 Type IV conjugative transfer system protein TraV [Acinetobacter baumannii]
MKRKGILLCLAINLSGCAAFNGGFDGLNGQAHFHAKRQMEFCVTQCQV